MQISEIVASPDVFAHLQSCDIFSRLGPPTIEQMRFYGVPVYRSTEVPIGQMKIRYVYGTAITVRLRDLVPSRKEKWAARRARLRLLRRRKMDRRLVVNYFLSRFPFLNCVMGVDYARVIV